MPKVVNAKPGMKFTMTLAGGEIPKIRGKFDGENVSLQKMYRHTVPAAWVEKGWVREVKEDDC
jgi:hypothetical protein